MSQNLTEIWKDFLKRINSSLGDQTYDTWFTPIQPVSFENTTLLLEVPNRFFQEWIKEHYVKFMETILSDIVSFPVSVDIKISEAGSISQSASKRKGLPSRKKFFPQQSEKKLNPRYTFDNFVVGPSNRFAYAASMAVAESPASAYNPLFIYGGVGLGKTHLMQAIGHYALTESKNSKVLYLSTEEFTNQLIDAIQNKNTIKFRNKYRTVDVLLIDDVHFLGGKEQTQEEFFHTFNALYNAHKQIVLSSDRPPKELVTLEERLVSRFEWGLVTDLQLPDMETRAAILNKKAEFMKIEIPEEILFFLASRIKTNIRKMEGALVKIVSYSTINDRPLSIDLAEEALQDILHDEKTVTIEQIQRKTAEHFDIRLADMTSKKRTQEIAFPRQIAMFLCRELTNKSLQEIGEFFGGRDHTTVMHARETIEKNLKKDFKLKKTVSFLRQKIQED